MNLIAFIFRGPCIFSTWLGAMFVLIRGAALLEMCPVLQKQLVLVAGRKCDLGVAQVMEIPSAWAVTNNAEVGSHACPVLSQTVPLTRSFLEGTLNLWKI